MRLMSLVPPKLAAQFRNTELMKMCFLHMSYLFCCGTGDNNNALLFFKLSCVLSNSLSLAGISFF